MSISRDEIFIPEISINELKKIVSKMGFRERTVEFLFSCAWSYYHNRGSVSIGDILIYFEDGTPVNPTEIQESKIEHIGSWINGTTYRWINEKTRVYTHNQLLDSSICFSDCTFIKDQTVLATLSIEKGGFMEKSKRYVTINGEKKQVFLYEELNDERLFLANGTLLTDERILNTYRRRSSVKSLKHYVKINQEEIQVYTFREIENYRLYKETLEKINNQNRSHSITLDTTISSSNRLSEHEAYPEAESIMAIAVSQNIGQSVVTSQNVDLDLSLTPESIETNTDDSKMIENLEKNSLFYTEKSSTEYQSYQNLSTPNQSK